MVGVESVEFVIRAHSEGPRRQKLFGDALEVIWVLCYL